MTMFRSLPGLGLSRASETEDSFVVFGADASSSSSFSSSSSPAFRFHLPGAAGRLRGGANDVVSTSGASSSAPSSSPLSSSFFGLFGRAQGGRGGGGSGGGGGAGSSGAVVADSGTSSTPKKATKLGGGFIADLAAAANEEDFDDDGYDSDSGSSSSSDDDDENNNNRGRKSLDEGEGYVNSYDPKGFEPDLGVRRILGDGKCMFRALARGMARNDGVVLSPDEETRDADMLRLAVRDVLCRSDGRRQQFHEAVMSVEVAEGGLPKYCARMKSAGFWGGEVELMVLSRLLQVPIYVYRTTVEAGADKSVGFGYAPIVKYGTEYAGEPDDDDEDGGSGGGGEHRAAGGYGGRKPVNLLYGQGNHYDLLVA